MPHFKIVCYSLVALFALAFGGCAPSTANKPEMTAAKSATTPTAPGGSGKGEGERGTASESSTAPGSLEALQTLKVNAEWLKRNPAARIEIEGHCDSRGTNEYNLALGAKRAQAAKDYLANLGISAERLSTISYGAEIPVCREQTESCWSQNRRARFVVIAGKPAS